MTEYTVERIRSLGSVSSYLHSNIEPRTEDLHSIDQHLAVGKPRQIAF